MLEVHERGRSVVWTGPRENAEAYAYTLQQWHLTRCWRTMKRIEVKLSLPVVAPLLDVIKTAADTLQGRWPRRSAFMTSTRSFARPGPTTC